MTSVPTSELRWTLVARDTGFWNLMFQHASKHVSINCFVERYVAVRNFRKKLYLACRLMKKHFSDTSDILDGDMSWCMLRAYNYICGSYKYGDSAKLCHTHLIQRDLEILLSFTYTVVIFSYFFYWRFESSIGTYVAGIGTSFSHGSLLQCSQIYIMRVCVYMSVSVCLCLCLCDCVCVCVSVYVSVSI